MKTGLIVILMALPLWGQRIPKPTPNVATPLSQRQALINAGLNGQGDNVLQMEQEPIDETSEIYQMLGLTGKIVRVYKHPYRVPAFIYRRMIKHKILTIIPSASRLTGVGASVELTSH